jgi:hypothetical protein
MSENATQVSTFFRRIVQNSHEKRAVRLHPGGHVGLWLATKAKGSHPQFGEFREKGIRSSANSDKTLVRRNSAKVECLFGPCPVCDGAQISSKSKHIAFSIR